jgi:hypothetical protein
MLGIQCSDLLFRPLIAGEVLTALAVSILAGIGTLALVYGRRFEARHLRNVDNPNEMFVSVEFDSAEEAKSFRDKVRDSDVLQNLTVKVPPTVAEVADQATS